MAALDESAGGAVVDPAEDVGPAEEVGSAVGDGDEVGSATDEDSATDEVGSAAEEDSAAEEGDELGSTTGGTVGVEDEEASILVMRCGQGH